eukprot:gene1825-967_t
MGGFPEIKNFIDQNSKNFKNLKVNYVSGSPPKLFMKNGKQEDFIDIQQWKNEQISEFLKQKLDD